MAAKDSEEDNPDDIAYMNGLITNYDEAMKAWGDWSEAIEASREAKRIADKDAKEAAEKAEAKAAEEAKVAKEKAEKLVKLRARLEMEVEAIEDPEKDFKDSIEAGICSEAERDGPEAGGEAGEARGRKR